MHFGTGLCSSSPSIPRLGLRMSTFRLHLAAIAYTTKRYNNQSARNRPPHARQGKRGVGRDRRARRFSAGRDGCPQTVLLRRSCCPDSPPRKLHHEFGCFCLNDGILSTCAEPAAQQSILDFFVQKASITEYGDESASIPCHSVYLCRSRL